jgi:hypothetical protein
VKLLNFKSTIHTKIQSFFTSILTEHLKTFEPRKRDHNQPANRRSIRADRRRQEAQTASASAAARANSEELKGFLCKTENSYHTPD